MKTAWDAFWFGPEPAVNLRAARIVLAANALWLALSRPHLPSIVRWPDAFWLHADTPVRVRFLIFPLGYTAEMFLWVILLGALVLSIFGIAVRAAGLASGILIYHFAPFEDIFTAVGGPNFRGFTVPLLGLLIIAFGHHPDRVSEDSPEWRWQLKLVQLLFAFSYLLSGISKLRLVGLRWATAANFEGLVLGLVFPDVVPSWAHWFIGNPLLCWGGALAGMAMDFGFVLAVCSRRAARIIVPLTFLTHLAIAGVMGVVFLATPLLLLFVNWAWLSEAWRARSGAKTGSAGPERG